VGIVEPAILLDRKPYIIIAGFRRIACARDLHMRSVPAFVVDLTEGQALLRAVHDNLERGYSIIEKAIILDKMKGADLSDEAIYAVMKLLDLNPHEKVLRSFLSIAKADDASKQFIFRHNLSLKNIESFLRFESGERKKIMASLGNFHLTESIVREILDMLQLILIRKGRLTRSDIPRKPDADSLRAHLKEKTNPILTSLTKKMKAIRERMSLQPGMDIRVDPFFEKEYIDVVLRITREEDMNAAFDRILKLAEAGHIRSILELTKGRIR
ncbi:MAG: ParB N-terminal domain-containing protein, partial [Syntrophorhabdus sp.]